MACSMRPSMSSFTSMRALSSVCFIFEFHLFLLLYFYIEYYIRSISTDSIQFLRSQRWALVLSACVFFFLSSLHRNWIIFIEIKMKLLCAVKSGLCFGARGTHLWPKYLLGGVWWARQALRSFFFFFCLFTIDILLLQEMFIHRRHFQGQLMIFY